MLKFIKNYWDIIGGILAGFTLTVIAEFELEQVQLYYSIIILMLVCIGILRIARQTFAKARERKTVIDSMVDSQKSIKAISLAQEPMKEGERVGKFLFKILEVINMDKIKTFFDKFKGYMLTIALATLTIVEQCGGFINAAFGGVLVINGVEVLPLVTLGCTVIVGMVSNGYTKEQSEKIKALFSKSNTNELVKIEIKKSLKDNNAKLAEYNKELTTKQHELANLNSELESANNTLQAKNEMYTMTPQLATAEDVQKAKNEVVNCEAKIIEKTAEIEKTKKNIENLTTIINALKERL